MIYLCSKSYIIEKKEGKQKISCKGVSKKSLNNAMQKFEETLSSKKLSLLRTLVSESTNPLYTYSQEKKIGFNYFYCKRKVLEDGITTEPLDLILLPSEENIQVIDDMHNPLSNLFQCKFCLNKMLFMCSSGFLPIESKCSTI